MPGPYHSEQNGFQGREICGMSLLPLKTKFKGPAAPPNPDPSVPDIVDEALDYFKANCLFKNYEVNGPADRVLIYLTLYIHQCLTKLESKNKGSGEKELYQLAISNYSIPGDGNFPLGGFVSNPADRNEADTIRQYFLQLRQEVNARLIPRVYSLGHAAPSKWRICFQKRKFINIQF